MVEYDFDGQVAFVTGAGRGQGRSHAVHYAENGADVVATDICETPDDAQYDMSGEDDLAETVAMVEERGQEALGVQMDVSKEADVERAVGEAIDEFGRIDILANNAGVAPPGALMEIDEATWDQALDVNLKGMWLCAKHVGNHMIERDEGGRIVNTSSTAGFVASPGLGHYTAAKHGVIGLTQTLAMELAQYDITVNAVCPSAVDTPMTGGIRYRTARRRRCDSDLGRSMTHSLAWVPTLVRALSPRLFAILLQTVVESEMSLIQPWRLDYGTTARKGPYWPSSALRAETETFTLPCRELITS